MGRLKEDIVFCFQLTTCPVFAIVWPGGFSTFSQDF
jgi:hypothetical protein